MRLTPTSLRSLETGGDDSLLADCRVRQIIRVSSEISTTGCRVSGGKAECRTGRIVTNMYKGIGEVGRFNAQARTV